MRIDHPEHEELVRRVREGQRVDTVARALGLSRSGAYKILRRVGQARGKPHAIPPEQIAQAAEIVRKLREGQTAVSVAAYHHMSTRTVSEIAARAGVCVAKLRLERLAKRREQQREQKRAQEAMSVAEADEFLARAVAAECERPDVRAEIRASLGVPR